MIDLAGHSIVVTGAAGGLGSAIVELLVDLGADVVAADLDIERAGTCHADRSGIRWLPLDVTDPASWRDLRTDMEARGNRTTGLVNNAGISAPRRASVLATSLDDWNRVLAVNTTGVLLGMQTFAPGMVEAGRGSIVNIGSITGLLSYPAVAYTASKWAVRGLTKVAATEFAPYGVRVNAVHPGVIATPMAESGSPTFLQRFAEYTPLGRAAQPADVASLVAYLCHDASAYLTGADLPVDGGFTAGAAMRRMFQEIRQDLANGEPQSPNHSHKETPA